MKKAIILSLLMLMLGTLCLSASAYSIGGSCGDSLTWAYDTSTATLTISGTGAMQNYNDLPYWNGYKQSIRRVIINEGCTAISTRAFSDCKNLTSISIPQSVTTIGYYAFWNCHSLTEISLPNVTTILSNAFMSCSGLEKISMPSVVSIGREAFWNCNSLTSVTIPNSTKTIGERAFYQCSDLTDLHMGTGLTEVGPSAFALCSNLTNIHWGTGLVTLKGEAFRDCVKLKSIRIPDTVKEIGGGAFYGCIALEELVIGAGVSNFSANIVRDCPNLKVLALSSSNPYFKTDNGVLYTKDGTELLYMPRGFTGSYTVLPGTAKIASGAFRETGLTSVTIPGSVWHIGSYAFYNCQNLKTIHLSEGVRLIENDAFAGTAIEEITLPESVNHLEDSAFSRCTSLKKIVFLGKPPETGYYIFDRVKATLYYPGGIRKWKEIDGWDNITMEAFICDNHTVVTVPAKAPTCTEDGYTESSSCCVCKLTFSVQRSLSKTGHTMGQWVKNNDTADTTWTHKRTCTACGYADIAQGNMQPNTLGNTNQNPSTETTPSQENTSVTDNPATDPVDTEADASGSKNALLFVGLGILLLGLATSGIVFFKPKSPRNKTDAA